MGNSNFVGGKLFNLKDKLSNTQSKQAVNKKPEESQSNKIDEQEPPPKILQEKTIIENTPPIKNLDSEHKISNVDDKKEVYDKSYQKALLTKKDDFIRTKRVVLKAISETAQTLFSRKEEIEKNKNECNEVLATIEKLGLKISSIDESKWKENELSIELMDANKAVENARIENILMQEKIKSLVNLDIKNDSSKYQQHSMIELLSLTYRQLFKFGLGFFAPVIIAMLLGAIIIAFSILGAMGAL